jgi:hypothetical protein
VALNDANADEADLTDDADTALTGGYYRNVVHAEARRRGGAEGAEGAERGKGKLIWGCGGENSPPHPQSFFSCSPPRELAAAGDPRQSA